MKRHMAQMTGMLAVTIMFAVYTLLAGTGCAVNVHKHAVTAHATKKAQPWKPGKRCKVVGKAKTSHVAVLVEKDCLRRGLTTVNMLVLNPEKKGKVAASHAAQAVVAILGFRPVLSLLVTGKIKGQVFYLTAVTAAENPLAYRQ